MEAGREIRLARLNAGATAQGVAERLGWSKSKVSRIERGILPRVALSDLAASRGGRRASRVAQAVPIGLAAA